jgi:tRNA (guanosine-2'-O-)-methyltransferase
MPTIARSSKLEKVSRNRQAGFILVAEDIHDPHNIQAIARTCDAFGIQTVYLIFDREMPFNPKSLGKSTSSSANKWLSYRKFKSASECYSELRKNGYTICGTALGENSENLFAAPLTDRKIALVVGNEHHGISGFARLHADRNIMIPMRGFVQSLNVSVAAAIIIAEITRQRQKSKNKYQLPEKDRKKLFAGFLKTK